jgi:hypothetical protein
MPARLNWMYVVVPVPTASAMPPPLLTFGVALLTNVSALGGACAKSGSHPTQSKARNTSLRMQTSRLTYAMVLNIVSSRLSIANALLAGRRAWVRL